MKWLKNAVPGPSTFGSSLVSLIMPIRRSTFLWRPIKWHNGESDKYLLLFWKPIQAILMHRSEELHKISPLKIYRRNKFRPNNAAIICDRKWPISGQLDPLFLEVLPKPNNGIIAKILKSLTNRTINLGREGIFVQILFIAIQRNPDCNLR